MNNMLKIIPLSAAALAFGLDIPITLFENTSLGAVSNEPMSFVVPLPKEGAFIDPAGFRLEDNNGAEIPSQCDVLTNWLCNRDQRSIQLLNVSALVDLPSGGTLQARLKDAPSGTTPASVQVLEASDKITVNTGPLVFTVKKTGFNIFDEVTLNGHEIVSSSPSNGGVLVRTDNAGTQYSADNSNLTVQVEESGPLRAVIRIFGRTRYVNKSDFTFGYICRIYAYAGKPWVRVDFSLRNTPHADEVEPAGPYYFEDFSLVHRLNLGASPVVRVAGPSGVAPDTVVGVSDSTVKIEGWLDVFDGTVGVMAYVRHFWENYPKENRFIPSENKLKIGLWPDGYKDWRICSWMATCPDGRDTGTFESDKYWMDDGMQKTFQVFYYFHDAAISDAELNRNAALFRRPPVGYAARSAWNNSKALSCGGHIDPAPGDPTYVKRSRDGYPSGWPWSYGYLDFYGAGAIGGVGGMPNSALRFIARGNPGYFFDWETYYFQETDVRYSHMDDIMATLEDTNMVLYPCAFYSFWYKNNWTYKRWWEDHSDCSYDSSIGGPHGRGAYDAYHAWTYPIYELYQTTGDRRIKDYFAEQAAFLGYWIGVSAPRNSVAWRQRPPDYTGDRPAANCLANAEIGYQVTGDTILHWLSKRFVDSAFSWFDRKNGCWEHELYPGMPVMTPGFLAGLFGNGLIYFITNCSPREEKVKQKAVSLVSAFMDAALGWGWAPGQGPMYHFGYDTATPPQVGSASSVTAGDALAWLYLTTGAPRYRDSLLVWMNCPLAGSYRPGDYFKNWNGALSTGRVTTYVENVGLPDTVLPAAIQDLTVSSDSKLSFTSPGGKGFLVRWYTKPIRDTYFQGMNQDTASEISWWAAEVSPSWVTPAPAGSAQTIELFDVPSGTTVQVMVKTIGHNNLWSQGSNLASGLVTQTIPSEGKWNIGVEENETPVADKFSMSAQPNPFNPLTTISYCLPSRGNAKILIFNLKGQKITEIALKKGIPSGRIVWNGCDGSDKPLSSGLYLVRLEAGNKNLTGKITLLR